jgi:hypothetical protein
MKRSTSVALRTDNALTCTPKFRRSALLTASSEMPRPGQAGGGLELEKRRLHKSA